MKEAVRRLAGEAWAFRARVERDADRRFDKLARAIAEFDPPSPVPALMRRAAEDERRHAVLCAQLAESFGQPARDDSPPGEIAPRTLSPRNAALYETVAACCITESESMAILTTLLAGPLEPRIREAVHEIARDEVAHSQMGWAHLAREASLTDVSFLSAWIPDMLAGTVDFAPAPPEPEGLQEQGVLPRARKREIFLAALGQIVLPGLEKFGVETAPARRWMEGLPSGPDFL